jgi:hypothetical protein
MRHSSTRGSSSAGRLVAASLEALERLNEVSMRPRVRCVRELTSSATDVCRVCAKNGFRGAMPARESRHVSQLTYQSIPVARGDFLLPRRLHRVASAAHLYDIAPLPFLCGAALRSWFEQTDCPPRYSSLGSTSAASCRATHEVRLMKAYALKQLVTGRRPGVFLPHRSQT